MALHEIIEVKKVMILGQEITYKNKFLKHSESTTYGFKPDLSLVSHSVRCFKYDYEHHLLPPTLFTNYKGEKFIVPSFTKVHPKTTLADINWIKPEKVEAPVEKNVWKFESSSDPGHYYAVRQSGFKLSCNCPGVWRSKDRRCKHIKEVEQIIKNDNK
jgi:hypothetical protein